MKKAIRNSIFGAVICLGLLGTSDPMESPWFGFDFFVDELPIPPRILVQPGQREIQISLEQKQIQLNQGLPASTVWTYNGSFPGPTIEVEKNQPLRVLWQNNLPREHFFPKPKYNLCEALPDVRSVTHLHGAFVDQPEVQDRFHNNDGWPDLWVEPGQAQVSDYPNAQDARTLWYHDHSFGTTGRNVAAGLAGLYLIHDDFERSLNLPSGDFDIPLVFQAHGLNANGSRYYTNDVTKEFYGNALTVNGKLWPVLTVEPRKYRFRMVNASNARSYGMMLVDQNTNDPGPAFYQVGTDAGFLARTAILNDPKADGSPRLLLSPGERADVIIDFSTSAGKEFLLDNNSREPGEGEIPIQSMMLFRVKKPLSVADTSKIPDVIRSIPKIDPKVAIRTRRVVLSQATRSDGAVMLQLNGRMWTDKIEEEVTAGTTEIWELVNLLPDHHPFHVHLAEFQVMSRQDFDVDLFQKNGELKLLGTAEEAPANERGWKDVVLSRSGQVTRIIIPFGERAAYSVYHCHILEHEDMDMMRPFSILKKAR